MSISEIAKDYMYISDYLVANDEKFLTNLGITHIINCAKEIPNYHEDKFTYLNLNLCDNDEDILKCQQVVLDFIDKAINGKILIHCAAGISRSAAITIMYLMEKLHLCYNHTVTYIKEKRRFINPNQYYVKQLTESKLSCSQCY